MPTLYIDTDAHRALKDAANQKGRKISEYAQELILKGIARSKPKAVKP